MHAQTYVHTYIYIAYSVVTKYTNALSTIAHQMWRSQVLPGYPHSSAGTYGTQAVVNGTHV